MIIKNTTLVINDDNEKAGSMCSVSHYWSWQPTNNLVISVFLITADDDHEDDYDGRPLTMRMVTMSMTMAIMMLITVTILTGDDTDTM